MSKKKKPIISKASDDELTRVDSRAYGTHYRRPRGSVKPISLNDSFQKSIDSNKLANGAAKAIKDALDPFRKGDFRDGTFWSRLLGKVKSLLHQDPKLDFRFLEDFRIHVKESPARNLSVETGVTLESGQPVKIEITSCPFARMGIREKVTHYELTIIAIFLNAELKATTLDHTVRLAIKTESRPNPRTRKDEPFPVAQKHNVEWPLPDGTRTILIVSKYKLYDGNRLLNRRNAMGMNVAKVISELEAGL